MLKYIKEIKWFIDVPMRLGIKSGCLVIFPYKKYPIKLPGNKYRINKETKEK